MAGNVTAFNTVFTYDIYQSYIKPQADDDHYLWVGRATTVVGIVLSIGTAYLAASFNNMMDFLQLIFAFVNAPLFATFLFGMFWKRTTGHAAFSGLLSGITAAALTWLLTVAEGKGGLLGHVYMFRSTMAQSYWIAIMSWTTCFVVTLVVSLMTAPKPESELKNLVYGFTDVPPHDDAPWYKRPGPLAVVVIAVLVVVNVIFW
jgi:SSS family solute:Na+ symporter